MRSQVLVPLLALAVSAQAFASDRARGYSLQLVDEAGRVLPTFEQDGRSYVLGGKGRRYSLRVRNGTSRRIEVVASVDGRDVLDGKPASFDRRGYLVQPYGEVVIDGFRLDDQSVAAFRFSSVSRSYASLMGDTRDVGVIGAAIFPERRPLPPPRVVEAQPRYDLGGAHSAGAQQPGYGVGPNLSRLGAQHMPAPPAPALRETQARKEKRPGLGTEFGEQRDSQVTEAWFERAARKPATVLSVRYDDRQGLLAMGVSLDQDEIEADARLRETSDPFRRDGYAEPPPGWCR